MHQIIKSSTIYPIDKLSETSRMWFETFGVGSTLRFNGFMKNTKTSKFQKMTLVAALLGVMSASAAFAKDGSAIVRAIKPTTRDAQASAQFATSSESSWKQLRTGKVLRGSDTIKTGAFTNVDMFLGANGPVLRVTEETVLKFDSLTFESVEAEMVIKTELDLRNGRILGRVKKLAAASEYTIKLPVGVAAIRGTDYDISANGKMIIREGRGEMNMVGAGGQVTSYSVAAGQVFDPQTQTVSDLLPEVANSVNEQINEMVGNAGDGAGSGDQVGATPVKARPKTIPEDPSSEEVVADDNSSSNAIRRGGRGSSNSTTIPVVQPAILPSPVLPDLSPSTTGGE